MSERSATSSVGAGGDAQLLAGWRRAPSSCAFSYAHAAINGRASGGARATAEVRVNLQ